jgi:predicted PurR-regulated permease PerM
MPDSTWISALKDLPSTIAVLVVFVVALGVVFWFMLRIAQSGYKELDKGRKEQIDGLKKDIADAKTTGRVEREELKLEMRANSERHDREIQELRSGQNKLILEQLSKIEQKQDLMLLATNSTITQISK